MFKLLGGLILCYVAYSLVTGEVAAREGLARRPVRREDDPFKYWSAIVTFVLMAVLLISFI